MNMYRHLQHPFGKRYHDASLSQSRLAKEDIQEIHSWLEEKENFLVFLGSPGCGKTYTCAAIYNWITNNLSCFIRHIFWHDLREEITSGFKLGGTEEEVLRKYADPHFLIIDDIGSDMNSAWQIRMLFTLIDKRYKECLPTIVTSNLTEEKIKEDLGIRIHSRLFATENHVITDWNTDYRKEEKDV